MSRIIEIVPSIMNEASGPSYSVVRLCESLIASGQEVTLVTLLGNLANNRHKFHTSFVGGLGPKRLGSSPSMRRWLEDQAKFKMIDILHNHSLWMMPNIYPGKIARKFRIPLVLSPRGTLSEWAMSSGSWLKQIMWPLLQREVLEATTCFHATAKSEYEDIRRLGFRQPVAVIPNGVDLPVLLPRPSRRHKTLLFLSRIHPGKGLDMLLSAWAAVQNRFPEWRLCIAGHDKINYLPKVQELARELSLERLEFFGPVYGADKWRLYQNSDLYILPTRSENFGMTVAEALASGTPAIVSKGAPWPGLEANNAGWWVDISIDSLVSSLEHAFALSDEELTEFGQRGRIWMEQEYSWGTIGRHMAKTYSWILGHGDKPNFIIE